MEKLLSIFEGDSIGSFYKAEIAHINDFLNMSADEVLFRGGRDWKELEITDETGNISFTEAETANGTIAQYSGGFGFHGPIQSISKVMRPYVGRKSVLRLTSLTDEVFILGDQFNPVTISSSADTGTRYINRPQINYSFSLDMPLEG